MHSFYANQDYRKTQSLITKRNWLLGKFNFRIKPAEKRICNNPTCKIYFLAKPYERNRFCSSRCSALVNNPGRKVSEKTRKKMSEIAKTHGWRPPQQPTPKHIEIACQNPTCGKKLLFPPHIAKVRKYCNVACAMNVIGKQTTSPKASKGKPGVRLDIDPTVCFYSTWEANVARVFNLVGIKWQYAPRIFDLGNHTYRPDFYLPDFDIYIEVKNFMGEYSKIRDSLFRSKYPTIELQILSKNEYEQIKLEYKPLIDNWE